MRTGTRTAVVAVGALRRLAERTAEHLTSALPEHPADRVVVGRFVDDLRAVGHRHHALGRGRPRTVRALEHLPTVLEAAAASPPSELLDTALDAVGHVRWTEFYAEDDWSASFLHLFANGEGVGPDGRLVDDQVVLGLYLFGPGLHYPAHAHPAEEIYVPLVGDAEFEVGAGRGHRRRVAGDVVVHRSDVSHSIRTATAAFGIYAWRGAIDAPSWYRSDPSDPGATIRRPTIAKR